MSAAVQTCVGYICNFQISFQNSNEEGHGDDLHK